MNMMSSRKQPNLYIVGILMTNANMSSIAATGNVNVADDAGKATNNRMSSSTAARTYVDFQ